MVTGSTNLLQFTFASASLERHQWWSARFSAWFEKWSWLHYAKSEILPSVFRVSLLTRKIYCRLLIAWSRYLFPLAFWTGKILQPSFPSTKLASVTYILCWRQLRFPLLCVMLVNCYSRNLQKSGWSEASVCWNYSVMLASLHGKAFPFTVTGRSAVILISWAKLSPCWRWRLTCRLDSA